MVRGYHDFCGFDPRTRDSGTFLLSLAEWDRIERYAPEHRKLAIFCVKEVVENPKVAFRGLRTVDEKFGDPREYVKVPDPDGLCLCAVPPPSVVSASGLDPRKVVGFTFAVFVDKDLKLLDWDWIQATKFENHHPVDWESRFVERIWQSP